MAGNLNSESRLAYVDVAKGIGIVLVVMGHNAAFGQETQAAKFIYSFHMPLFYFLAGLFHNDARSLVSHVARKAKGLLLPCVLAFAAFVLVQAVLIPDTLYPALRNLSINALYGTGKTMFWGQLWFLTSLFVTTCACHVLIRSRILSNKGIRIIIAIILVPTGTWFLAWAPTTHYLNWFWINNRYYFSGQEGLPWNIDLLAITAAFYLWGTTFPKRHFGNQWSKSSSYFITSAGAFAIVAAGSLLMDWGMDLNIRRYNHWAGSSLVAICGIGGVLLLSLTLEKLVRQWPSKTLDFIGKHSLFILVLHFSFQQNCFGKMVAEGVPWLAAVIGSFAVGLGVPLGTSLLWERVRARMKRRRELTR